jgi:hypothetical protein
VVLFVRNPHATLDRDITFITGLTVEGFAVADMTVTIPAVSDRWFGPFTPGTFNQVDGTVQIDVTGTLDVVAFNT